MVWMVWVKLTLLTVNYITVDLPPFVRTSDPSPAHFASPPLQRSPHLHDRAIDTVPD